MTCDKNPYAQKIIGIIAPLMGQALACGTIKTNTAKLGITEDGIKPEHLPALANSIERGLIIFLGSDGAKKIADQIRMIK